MYSREAIISPDFKIKPEDFHNVKISRSQGTRAAEAEPITGAKVAKLFETAKKTPKKVEINDEIADALGIKRGKPMTFEEANEMRSNPRYKRGVKYRVNCQASVVANEMRRRGYDVEAYGYDKNNWETVFPSLSQNTQIAFLDANGKFPEPIKIRYSESIMKSLNAEMREPGRYHLRFHHRKRSGGHIITAERLKDGTLRIYDPQPGQVMKDFEEKKT